MNAGSGRSRIHASYDLPCEFIRRTVCHNFDTVGEFERGRVKECAVSGAAVSQTRAGRRVRGAARGEGQGHRRWGGEFAEVALVQATAGAPVGIGRGTVTWTDLARGAGLLAARDVLVAIGGGRRERGRRVGGRRLVTQEGRQAHPEAGEGPTLPLGPGGTGGIGGQESGQEATTVGCPRERPGHAEHGARSGRVIKAQAIDRWVAAESAQQEELQGVPA
jgi:hypothetical protein